MNPDTSIQLDPYLEKVVERHATDPNSRTAMRRLLSVVHEDEVVRPKLRAFWQRLATRALEERIISYQTSRNYVSTIMRAVEEKKHV